MNDIDSTQYWKTYSQRLKEVLELKGSPIAVSYSNIPAQNASEKRFRVCGAIPGVRDGAIINLSAENCACGGGIKYLGLGPSIEGLESFLVYGEKLWGSLAAARRAMNSTEKKAPPPIGLAKYVVLSPLEKAEIKPDLVLIICNAMQASRLVTLAGFKDGIIPSSEVSGSLCWSAITYSLVTGNFNVTMGDPSARRIENWDPNELIVTVPYYKLDQIIESIDYCTAGVAKPSKEFEEIVQRMSMEEPMKPEELKSLIQKLEKT